MAAPQIQKKNKINYAHFKANAGSHQGVNICINYTLLKNKGYILYGSTAVHCSKRTIQNFDGSLTQHVYSTLILIRPTFTTNVSGSTTVTSNPCHEITQLQLIFFSHLLPTHLLPNKENYFHTITAQ